MHRNAGRQAASRVTIVETKRVSAAVVCHQCEHAPCVQVCPVGVIRRVDGIVRVDEQRCVACKMCAIACPFGAMQPAGTSIAGVAGTCFETPTFPASTSPLLRWEIGVAACAVKCELCEGLADRPRCIDACPTEALSLVDDDLREARRRERMIDAADRLASVSDTWKNPRRPS